MNRLALLYFVIVVALFTGSCWGDFGECPTEPVQSFEIKQGEYRVSQDGLGELEYGRPVFGELDIDLQAGTARLTYEIEGGSLVVEEYEFEPPSKAETSN